MITTKKIIFFILILLIGYFFGFTNYKIKSVSNLNGLMKGKLYDFGGFDESRYIGEIDTSLLSMVIQYNEWQNLSFLRRPINDVRLGVEFSNGSRIRFAGNYFTIPGESGYFFIQESQLSTAKNIHRELLQKIVIPHRMNHDQRTDKPSSPE